jgi:uncharacterized protein YbjT (DUF2867 family)
MRVILFGGSGMVGQGVLRECLASPAVTEVLSIGRTSLGQAHEKLTEISLPDVGDLSSATGRLRGWDGCFWCLGVSSAGREEAEYRRLTFDLTLRAARTLAAENPEMTFTYVSGAGTDSSEQGRSMWARVKGATENALLRLPFRAAYMFRPGLIRPGHGIRSKTRSYRIFYTVLGPFLAVGRFLFPNAMTSSEQIGRAMIEVVYRGASSKILGNREINALASRRASG